MGSDSAQCVKNYGLTFFTVSPLTMFLLWELRTGVTAVSVAYGTMVKCKI